MPVRVRVFVATLLLLAAGPVLAGGDGAGAEEIRNIVLCHQVVALARQRGEHTGLICQIDYMRPPQYWQCLVTQMKQGTAFKRADKSCR